MQNAPARTLPRNDRQRRRHLILKQMKANYFLYIFLLPATVYLALFAYWPLYGIQIAFKDFFAFKGIEGSPWVGLKHFRNFFNSPRFSMLLSNTLTISFYSLLAGFPMPIILALLLNYTPKQGLKRFAQTASYAPHFISIVVLAGMLNVFLSPRSGFINTLLGYLGRDPFFFMGSPSAFKHVYVWSGVWQSTGWSSIIYLAALSGVSPELHEAAIIVDFLKNPKRYVDLGARIPKGVLLVGPPGTGKTLLAKAVAGEANVPFFSISGSDFVEMFVGVGASRVRDLFEQAKRNAPSIVFIDEIDAVGRHRGAGLGGGHDEREQTLNQLLVEMDGFSTNEGVIVMAATNRRDILDPALLRPGRFDRQITVNYPDVNGRVAILKVHSKGKPLAANVDLENIAKRTPFATGADLENVMNEGALQAARENKQEISQENLVEAVERIQMGPEKRSHKVLEEDRKIVAYHEAGHAIVGHYLPKCDDVHMITIVPRGQAGGFTLALPEKEFDHMSRYGMDEKIAMLLGGRAAESLTLEDITTGAASDLKRATEIARAMVTKYGMSEKLGAVYLASDQEVFVGMEFGQSREYSEETSAIIDEEVRKLLSAAYDKAVSILQAHLDQLNGLAKLLIEKETVSREEFVQFMQPALEAPAEPAE